MFSIICFAGNTADILATLDLITGLVVRNPEDELITTYESKLVRMLNCSDDSITMETLVEIIIAGECFKLEKLLSAGVELASKCDSKKLKGRKRYRQISNDTKFKIDQERLVFKEKRECDRSLRCEFN